MTPPVICTATVGDDTCMPDPDKTATVDAEPLAGLPDSERLELAIKFGRVRMCAALSHGHSFEQSIFKLPSKCSACQEVVWGPFNRGCTCLTCKLTAHRACTGMESMPRCPTKSLFTDFCRSELGLNSPQTADAVAISADDTSGKQGCPLNPNVAKTPQTSTHRRGASAGTGDLSEWAEVEGGGNTDEESSSREYERGRDLEMSSSSSPSPFSPPPASMHEIRDLGSSFSWSPFSVRGGQRKSLLTAEEQSYEKLPTSASDNPSGEDEERADIDSDTVVKASLPAGADERSARVDDYVSAADLEIPNRESTSMAGLTGFSKISVAGGVVGAVLAGPSGAMVGLKLGAVLAAGRWSAQGLWQRIEQDRKAAGAEVVAVAPPEDGAAAVAEVSGLVEPQDIWALIAERVEGEKHAVKWKLDTEQEERLEQGECDAAEVAMFVVGKVLVDETALPSRLYHALLAEFHSRHRLCECGRVAEQRRLCHCTRSTGRRSRDMDMVSVFPRSGGGRRGTRLGPDDAGDGGGSIGGVGSLRSPSDTHDQQQDSGFFAQTPGLEKTFSFVEETELVEGEGSETFVGDDGESSAGGGKDENRIKSVSMIASSDKTASSPLRPGAAEGTTPASAGEEANLFVPSNKYAVETCGDLWRVSSSRTDSWVELEGTGCNSCGGRVSATNGSSKGRVSSSLIEGVEEEEDVVQVEFGDSWAAPEAPPCWCMDESGLSASPDSSWQSALHQSRRESTGDRIAVEDTQQAANTLKQAAARTDTKSGEMVVQNGRQDDGGITVDKKTATGAEDHLTSSQDEGSKPEEINHGIGDGETQTNDEGDNYEEGAEARGAQEEVLEPCDALRDVHGVLRELTRAVLACCPLIASSDEAAIHAVNCIDQRVFAETYGPVYGRIASRQTVRDRDAALARRTRRDARTREAAGRPSLVAACSHQVLAAFRAVGAARTGRDKLGFLVQGVEKISEALPAKATTDTLIWSLCRHLAAATMATGVAEGVRKATGKSDDTVAALPRPHAEVAFVEQFVRDESWLMGKQGYVLTTVDAALHVLLNPEMSDDIFADVNPEGLGGDNRG